MRGWLPWIAAGAAGACYSPRATSDCQVICNEAAGDRCPDGFACGPSGLCSAGGAACPGDRNDAGEICFGAGIARPCVAAVPPGTLTLSGDLDTDRDARCVDVAQPAGGPRLCVIAGEQIAITGPVHAFGARPLVLVASGTIAVHIPLDASSRRGEPAGAGAGSCRLPDGRSADAMGSGGAGGSFQGLGGTGGTSSSVGERTPPEPALSFPAHVRGGCSGGRGGEGTSSTLHRPGAGGGALYLIANGALDVQSVIAANGAGALHMQPDIGSVLMGGGGGGGSGGLLVLEAPVITLGSAARLLAIGGAGAGGGGSMEMGKAGGDPDPTAMLPVDIAARGGPGGPPEGGNGGDGSSLASLAGGAAADSGTMGGAGGGGGAAGFIKLICATCPDDTVPIIPPRTP